MNFNNVLKTIDNIEAGNKSTLTESKKVTDKTVLEEGLDLGSLKALSGQSLAECGMPAMGAPMPPMAPPMPASLNMSAGNAGEIVQMVRGLMNLAATDAPSEIMGTGMPAIGAEMPPIGHEIIPDAGTAEIDDAPGDQHASGLGGAPVPDVPGMEVPGDAGIPGGGDNEILDLIKKIKTGEPVKVTTDMPVKVSTTDPIKGSTTEKHTSRDKETDEGAGSRDYDNSPHEKVKDYDPNDFAQVVNKVRDFDYTPASGASNPMPDQEEKEKEKSEESFESQLFAEYKKFVNESKKSKPDFLDIDKDGNKTEPMKKAAKDKKMKEAEEKRAPAKEKEREVTLPSGAKIKSRTVQGWQSQKADTAAQKEKGLDETEERVMTRAAKGVMKYGKDGMKALAKAGKDGKDLDKVRDKYDKYKYDESAKPSAGMTKKEKSSVAKKARAGKDIGKPGKNFDKVAAKAGGGEKGKRIAAAAMWKNAAK